MPSMPDIKLTRTDTTHDLSQKAEKRYLTIDELLVDFPVSQNTIGMWYAYATPQIFTPNMNSISYVSRSVYLNSFIFYFPPSVCFRRFISMGTEYLQTYRIHYAVLVVYGDHCVHVHKSRW
jgi:hypothetical protein